MLRIALLHTIREAFEGEVAKMYDSGLMLLISARTDADEMLALQVAGALSATSTVNPDLLQSTVAQCISMGVQQAEAVKRSLQRALDRLQAEVERMTADRDAVKAKLGEQRWKAGNKESERGMRLRELQRQLREALVLQAEIAASEPKLQSLKVL